MSGRNADGNLSVYEGDALDKLRPLRRLVLETAAATSGVGQIEESLKWGEPSYTPAKKGIGSSVRLAVRRDGKVSMNFICHTGLVGRFSGQYPNALVFEGNRSIVIDPHQPLPQAELRHCIAQALTYHHAKSRTPE